MSRVYITTAIPYVNARPHLGHALEVVQADVLARHRRARGDDLRFLTGTDDNALKNVRAAREAGVPTAEFVERNARRFEALRGPLELSNDDFLRTSADPRHRPAVERIWRRCREAGDLYTGRFAGRYCVGCEAFVDDGDLTDGRCPDHGTVPEEVAEENWFFRLSRYQDVLEELIASGRLRILPEAKRNEVLAFVRSGLRDVSVSRPSERSEGWGIGVPDDPSQTVYVWFDALTNYVSALGYGTGAEGYERWWTSSDERIHVIGKGILRFHAVWWPAALLSSGEPLPTRICVHDYLTAGGRKISKSSGEAADPTELTERFGPDAVRWWLLRDVPRVGDADFTVERLVERHDADLANGLGNAAARVISLGRGSTAGAPIPEAARLRTVCEELPGRIDAALARFDLRSAATALVEAGAEVDRLLEATRPWELRRGARRERELAEGVLSEATGACRRIASELRPFLPSGASRLEEVVEGRARGATFTRIGSGERSGC